MAARWDVAMRIACAALAPLAAASVLGLAGCMPFVPAGPMASEEREIEAVTTVVLDSSGTLAISEGEPSLVIHASEGALDRLTADVEGDSLVLGVTPGTGSGLGQVRYDLTLPALEAIELSGSGDVAATVAGEGAARVEVDGSGDVDWTGLDIDRVEVRLSGSGDIKLAGTTTELDIELDGSGEIDAEDLRAEEAVVSVAGSGDVSISVSEHLSADLSGSGSVTYSGDPQVETNVSGSGEITRR